MIFAVILLKESWADDATINSSMFVFRRFPRRTRNVSVPFSLWARVFHFQDVFSKYRSVWVLAYV